MKKIILMLMLGGAMHGVAVAQQQTLPPVKTVESNPVVHAEKVALPVKGGGERSVMAEGQRAGTGGAATGAAGSKPVLPIKSGGTAKGVSQVVTGNRAPLKGGGTTGGTGGATTGSAAGTGGATTGSATGTGGATTAGATGTAAATTGTAATGRTTAANAVTAAGSTTAAATGSAATANKTAVTATSGTVPATGKPAGQTPSSAPVKKTIN